MAVNGRIGLPQTNTSNTSNNGNMQSEGSTHTTNNTRAKRAASSAVREVALATTHQSESQNQSKCQQQDVNEGSNLAKHGVMTVL
jgi:hypothetical protein